MLTKDEIINRTNKGLDVFKYFIKSEWRVGRNFLNPFYDDQKASCTIYFDKYKNIYKLKDFGNPDYSGDCFTIVGLIYKKDCRNANDFIDILKIINEALHLGLSDEFTKPMFVPKSTFTPLPCSMQTAPIIPEVKRQNYSFTKQQLTSKDLLFWQQYGIDHHLLARYHVVSVAEFSSVNKDNKPYNIAATMNEPMFGYVGKQNIKLYRPYSNLRFMYGGSIERYCFGLEQLLVKGDILFITAGEKDVLSLAARGFSAICFNSETVTIPKSIIKKLTHRFKHLVLLYDCDKTGLEASLKQQELLKEYDIKRLVLPLSGTKEEKDISDYFKIGNSKNDLLKLFLKLLDGLYEETFAVLKPCLIDFNNPPPKPPCLISINDVPIGTQGNLLCITGGEGSGKSNFIGAILAGAVQLDNVEVDTLGTQIRVNHYNQVVLLYDTEQSEDQLYKNVSMIVRRSKRKDPPDYFKAYCINGISRKERLQAIVCSMDRYYYQYGGIYMVVIDGIADLIRGVNDEAESIELIDELHRLAGIYKTCIVCVLHLVPNGMKIRGHLGSELQRKAAGILSIEKEEETDISVVKALKVRDGSPLDVPMNRFAWDKQTEMHVFQGEKSKDEKDKRKEQELIKAATEFFKQKEIYTYAELCTLIANYFDVKERTAKSYVKFMRDYAIISKNSENLLFFSFVGS